MLECQIKADVRKVQKHENIKYTAKTKLSSIAQIVSRALEDEKISDDEFKFILREADSYREQKTTIRDRTLASLNE